VTLRGDDIFYCCVLDGGFGLSCAGVLIVSLRGVGAVITAV
jgi:hypothetical protein